MIIESDENSITKKIFDDLAREMLSTDQARERRRKCNIGVWRCADSNPGIPKYSTTIIRGNGV